MTTKVRINRESLSKALRSSAQAKAVLDATAELVSIQIAVLAPKHTRDFEQSIGWRNAGALTRRIYSSDPAGHMVEWGSVNNPPYAPFRRGARALGMTVTDRPKP